MTQHLPRVICIAISSILVAFPCINIIDFLDGMSYSYLINYLDNTTGCSLTADILTALKYFSFASVVTLALAILCEQCRKLYSKCENEYEWLGITYDTRCCGHGSQHNLYSNNLLTFVHYVLTVPCFLLWAITVARINGCTSTSFSIGMYLMITGFAIAILNMLSFVVVICLGCKHKSNNAINSDTMDIYIT